MHPDNKTKTLDVVENELSKGTDVINFENRYRCKNGSYRWFMWTAKPVTNEGIMFAIARDITKLKHDDEELKKHRDHLKTLVAERTLELAKVNEELLIEIGERKQAEETLQEQKKALEQKNIALNEVLGQIEIEKKQTKDNVIANAETLLLPIIHKLRLTGESRKYVQLLRKNLQELTSSFGTKLTEKRAKLTSREIEICNMIKNGLTSKEIASLLNISLRTAEKHRINIRNKLGIVNKDINLASFLKTF
jgi:DNA-binding CsgD family transcriptional regulator